MTSQAMTARPAQASEATDDPRWRAWRARDARADGTFVFSVRTTGVYCRPSCGARAARPENVAFHATPGDARRAGFRPCKRCRPDGAAPGHAQAALVADLCRLIAARIAAGEAAPALDELAARANLSTFHLHRLFKSTTGLTPRSYAAAARAGRVRELLARRTPDGSLTDVIYAAGYGSSGRFYEATKETLGMTPTTFRAGGRAMTIHFAVASSSLGQVLAAATERGLCAILLDDDRRVLERELARRFPRATLVPGDRAFARTLESVVGLVERPRTSFDLPLDLQGTVFQQRVWEALRRIPAGKTATYAEIARAIGAPRAVRAVAGACAANHVSVVVPCHRVVRTDGGLSGYYWGVARKRTLLEREGARPKTTTTKTTTTKTTKSVRPVEVPAKGKEPPQKRRDAR
jgi:AraC family transcriptional regulator, regulatory protein of adaptative response / methylated-DNA-[protein]-cysteine methyltransferase